MFVIIVSFISVEHVLTQNPPGCLGVDPSQRVECGYPDISEELCLERKCCYDSSVSDTLHCFQTQACAVDPVLRVECGHGTITIDECLERGCCWEDHPDAPRHCYQKASKNLFIRQIFRISKQSMPAVLYCQIYGVPHGSILLLVFRKKDLYLVITPKLIFLVYAVRIPR